MLAARVGLARSGRGVRALATVATGTVPAPAAAAHAAHGGALGGSGLAPGGVVMWGKEEDHRLGVNLAGIKFGTQAVALGPALPPTLHTGLPPMAQVVCRASKTLALGLDGRVYSWGTCPNKSLGHSDTADVVPRPKVVEALAGINIVAVRSPLL